ncbi:unnamed protein product [Rodentolepis nana]|uniref:Aberrant root formation protein 4 n=1 Tax=Rodentolepis nana TaxID=102285 RepID=A0A0R3TI43_RODNA|nr:unnamed protein product [Rodentolepis nana]
MSSEQTICEESLQSPSTDQGNVGSMVRMLQESGDNFVHLLPSLKRCVDDLCRKIEWITRVPLQCNLGDDARNQVISFLLDYGTLLNILAEVNPIVKGICNRLKAAQNKNSEEKDEKEEEAYSEQTKRGAVSTKPVM